MDQIRLTSHKTRQSEFFNQRNVELEGGGGGGWSEVGTRLMLVRKSRKEAFQRFNSS